MPAKYPVASIGESSSASRFLDLERGGTIGWIVRQQATDQIPQRRAAVTLGTRRSSDRPTCLAGQQPREQRTEVAEIGGALVDQADVCVRDGERVVDCLVACGFDREAGQCSGEIELGRSSVDQRDLTGTEPAVRQSQAMRHPSAPAMATASSIASSRLRGPAASTDVASVVVPTHSRTT